MVPPHGEDSLAETRGASPLIYLLLGAAAIFGIGVALHNEALEMLMVAMATAVTMVPEGLPAGTRISSTSPARTKVFPALG